MQITTTAADIPIATHGFVTPANTTLPTPLPVIEYHHVVNGLTIGSVIGKYIAPAKRHAPSFLYPLNI